MGVRNVMDVECQLECHGFGGQSCEAVAHTPFVNGPPESWHVSKDAQLCYGNPRCTGFSCISAGCGEHAHGPWSGPTIDIHQMCEYAAGNYDIVIWESVQQAYSVGRPLLDYLRDEIFVPKHYRVAHVFINAASFGNAQQRKRYFFVAYRDDRNFNIVPPNISANMTVTADVIWDMRTRVTREGPLNSGTWQAYDQDTYCDLTPDEKLCVPNVPNGWDANGLGRYAPHLLPPKWQDVWKNRCSDMPFSMHGVRRVNWLAAFPTIHSGATRCIHPSLDRPLTVGELSAIMGWPDIPRGPAPIKQIAKGIVPAVGEWLAEQAKLYLDDHWGDEDWQSSYCHREGEWIGGDANGAVEKVFDMTKYYGDKVNYEEYAHVGFAPQHRLDVARGLVERAPHWA